MGAETHQVFDASVQAGLIRSEFLGVTKRGSFRPSAFSARRSDMPFTFTQSAFSALRAGSTGPVPTPWMGAPDDPAGMGAARDFAPSSSRAARSQHRVDKVRLMEEGSRTLQRHAAETLGAALDAGKAERAHARLKRMAAFDSHDYDPADNDLRGGAPRAHEARLQIRQPVEVGPLRDDRRDHGLRRLHGGRAIDKLNAFKYGSVTTLIDDGFSTSRCG